MDFWLLPKGTKVGNGNLLDVHDCVLGCCSDETGVQKRGERGRQGSEGTTDASECEPLLSIFSFAVPLLVLDFVSASKRVSVVSVKVCAFFAPQTQTRITEKHRSPAFFTHTHTRRRKTHTQTSRLFRVGSEKPRHFGVGGKFCQSVPGRSGDQTRSRRRCPQTNEPTKMYHMCMNVARSSYDPCGTHSHESVNDRNDIVPSVHTRGHVTARRIASTIDVSGQ